MGLKRTLIAESWNTGRVFDPARQQWIVVLLVHAEGQQVMVALSHLEARQMATALLEAGQVPA